LAEPQAAQGENAAARLLRSASAICFGAAAVLMVVFGIIYMTRSDFMPYHATAVGVGWDSLAPAQRSLILSLMKATGAGALAAGVSIILLLARPFRDGEKWAVGAILAVGLTAAVPYLYTMYRFEQETPGTPPVAVPAVGVALLLAGFFLSRAARRI
jgi:hypothetical protein